MQLSNINLRKQLLLLYGSKSNTKATLAILCNWVAFILCFILIGLVFFYLPFFMALIFYLVISFVAGCCLRGFDNLTHEASHNNIFSVAVLHHYLQFLFAYPVFKTVQDYGPGHWKHHRNYRKHKDDDPDTQQNIRWGVEHLPAEKTVYQILWFYVIRFFMLYYMVDNIRHNFIPHLISKNSIAGRILFWGLILFAVAFTHTWLIFLLGYLIPYFLWLPYIRFVTESSKHTNVNLEDDFATSRNNIGIIHQYLLHPHNDGFHLMHHYISSIPFYNLKKAYIYMKADPEVKKRLIESFNPFQTIKQIFKIK